MGLCPTLVSLLALVALAAYPLEADARDSWFFSKVSRSPWGPETKAPAQATPEQGYGLFGKKETYEYPPTTTNPTKSEPGGRGKQGMSDTRFLENGRYFYDLENQNEEDAYNGRLMETNHGHHTYYATDSRTAEKQGMSDTRILENGRYFYDINAEADPHPHEYNGYSSNAQLYTDNKDEDTYDDELYGSRDTQAMNDPTFARRARYYNPAENEAPNKEEEGMLGYQGESYADKENVKSGKGYDFKTTPNKFPNYEFDSIEEYQKYEQGRSHQKGYAP